MINHDAADDPAASEFTDPITLIEGEEEEEGVDLSFEQQIAQAERRATRDAAKKFFSQIHAVLTFVAGGRSSRDMQSEMGCRLLVVMSAYQHPRAIGRSDIDLAAECGVHKADFSKHKRSFQRGQLLPPVGAQKSVEACATYSETRKEQLYGHAA
jgi:hypothetical protein